MWTVVDLHCLAGRVSLNCRLCVILPPRSGRVTTDTRVPDTPGRVPGTIDFVGILDQADVDRYLPDLDLPHCLHTGEARTIGGLAWPHEGLSMRLEIDEAMRRVPGVYEECRAGFRQIFGRDPGAMIEPFCTDDADTLLVASGTIATTAREVVRQRRAAGEKVGMIKIKMFRPFPQADLQKACRSATRVAVLDRNYAAGIGGIFWQDIRAGFQGRRDDLLIQSYLTGLCGGDVTSRVIEDVLSDIGSRETAGEPLWMGIDAGEEATP